MEMFEIHWPLVFQLVSLTHSYHLQCPDISQRLLRASGYCTSRLRSKYTCLYDTNMLSYFEQCNRNPDFVTPGEKYVISGNLRNVDCSSDRYQPFRLWSNVSGECLNKKSLCEGEGQVIFNNGSLIEERTCRCDYTKGYKFIKRPKQNCSCNPSEEDCSCYISECLGGTVLSPDYKCVADSNHAVWKCPVIQIESDRIQTTTIKGYAEKQKQLRISLIAVSVMFFLILTYTVTVFSFWDKIRTIANTLDTRHVFLRSQFTTGNEEEPSRKIIDPVLEEHISTNSLIITTSQNEDLQTDMNVQKKEISDQNDILQRELNATRNKLNELTTSVDKVVKARDKAVAELIEFKQQVDQKDTQIVTIQNNLEQTARTHDKERRELLNRILELKGNIRVFCRVRPLLTSETLGNDGVINHMHFEEKKVKVLEKTGNKSNMTKRKGNKTSNKHEYSFDKVFNDKATQFNVFTEISQLVQSALDGYSVCIFAYGQTGSGKTFTMEGTSVNDEDANRGMIPRAVYQIFDTISQLKSTGWKYSLDISFLELYNDKIRDLLVVGRDDVNHEIKMSEQDKDEVTVSGLTNIKEPSKEEVYKLLKRASKNRATGKTNCNDTSSRSHSVFILKLKGESNAETRKGTLHLVDLAGSERSKESGAIGLQQKEASAINSSLSELKNVIRAIRKKSEVKNREMHIPYRNSKLTHLLMNSLGGNSKTLMFVNISPTEKCVEETIRSLKFAEEVNLCEIGPAQQKK